MPFVEEDLSEGLRLSEGEDGKLRLVRKFDCQDLDGLNPVAIFASALKLTSGGDAHTGGDVPDRGELLVVNGRSLYVRTRDLEPFPPKDAGVTVTYTEAEPPTGPGYGPVTIEVGSTVELGETEFDADALALPYAQRTPIYVEWDPTVSGAPGAAGQKQTPRVPIFLGKACRRYVREQSVNPEALAELFVGCTNSVTWKGLAQDMALCVDIHGRNSGDGRWVTNFDVAIDRIGLFRQVARAIDTATGEPAYLGIGTAGALNVANNNGIKLIRVQGRADFNAWGLP